MSIPDAVTDFGVHHGSVQRQLAALQQEGLVERVRPMSSRYLDPDPDRALLVAQRPAGRWPSLWRLRRPESQEVAEAS